jgi:hypothetical protein
MHGTIKSELFTIHTRSVWRRNKIRIFTLTLFTPLVDIPPPNDIEIFQGALPFFFPLFVMCFGLIPSCYISWQHAHKALFPDYVMVTCD